MKVAVAQHHINGGTRGHNTKCALALALADATGKEFFVFHDSCHPVHTWETRLLRLLPPEARRFIEDFDGGVAVEPCEFELPTEETK